MEKSQFQENLNKATEFVLKFTRGILIDELPLPYSYLIFPNQSYDENPLMGDEELFSEDSKFENKANGSTKNEVLEFLWREGKVPEWINLSVHSYDSNTTYLKLLCCGRFTADNDFLYHKGEGFQPFHVLSPPVPPNFEGIENGRKFNLYWHGRKPSLNEPYYCIAEKHSR